MRRWLQKVLLTGCLMAVSALSGCAMPNLTANPEELYALPILPAKYTELNARIAAILESGAEYAAPTSGTNIQPVQLVDLDGDRREEAVAFFRNSNDEKPLKIYVFTTSGEDGYRQADLIEGSGTGIYSISYQDLDSDGQLELAVGWKVTANQQVLEVYALRPDGARVLVQSDYVKYTSADLDQDQRKELVVFRTDEEGHSVADYYNWQDDGVLTHQGSGRISMTMGELSSRGKVTLGVLEDQVPALFVTGVTDTTRAVTDILAVKNGELNNLVLSAVTGVSRDIAMYRGLYPSDINGDGLTEVPEPVRLQSLRDEGLSYYRVDWRTYDANGRAAVAERTYHNLEDGWYFRMPEEWVNRIWISRSLTQDEAIVTFYILGADGVETEPFLRIAASTGSNREQKAVRGERFLLSRQSKTIYTGELLEANGSWRYAATADEVRQAFSLLAASEWTSGDY